MLATSPVAAAERGSGTTPTPQPLWNAYPLDAQQSPARPPRRQPARPRTRPVAGNGSSSIEPGLAIAGGALAALVLVAAGVVLYRRRDRRDAPGERDAETAEQHAVPATVQGDVAIPAGDRPAVRTIADYVGIGVAPASTASSEHRFANPRTREVVADLLDAAGAPGGVPARDDEGLVQALCAAVTSATRRGEIEWAGAGADAYVWERAYGSLTVRRLSDGSHVLDVSDWNGARLETITSQTLLADAPADVYAAADESTSSAYEPIDAIIDALRGETSDA